MNEEIMNPEPAGMIVNEKMKADLLSAKKWAKPLFILRCIGVAVLVFHVFLIMMMSLLPESERPFGVYGPVLAVFVLAIAAAWVYIITKGFQFVNGIEKACYYNDESSAERSFAGMRDFLRCSGILTIVVTSVYFLCLIFAIVGTAAR